MTPREIVFRTTRFQGAERVPRHLPEPYGSDFVWIGMDPSPDARPPNGPDEWGAVWRNIGVSSLGEVEEFPLKDWKDFENLAIPDITEDRRWKCLEGMREKAGDKFILADGVSLYERIHFIRGIENTWVDIYEAPEHLARLIDILVEMNLHAVKRFAEAGADGYFWCDDWGLQNRLMISPESWHNLWQPAYARIYEAVHKAGMLTMLHSCGHIVEIMDRLIDAGLDIIQLDQQENMGLELLGERFGGRITFFSPVDIQNTMVKGTLDEIRAYCRRMIQCLGRPQGGFISSWYSDPAGAGHRRETIDAMCEQFMRLGADGEYID
jgi:uroporphyrinogen decarboxylase